MTQEHIDFTRRVQSICERAQKDTDKDLEEVLKGVTSDLLAILDDTSKYSVRVILDENILGDELNGDLVALYKKA